MRISQNKWLKWIYAYKINQTHMKVTLAWHALTDEQKKQVKSFYEDELKHKELFEHDLNRRSYAVNITDGSIVMKKDF